jgi:hypothetical protein
MPGLKAGGEKKGLANITAMMQHRQEERTPEKELPAALVEPVAEVTHSEREKPEPELESVMPAATVDMGREKVYGGTFEKVAGATVRKKYEHGNMPRVHRILLNAICDITGMGRKMQVVLGPILEEHQISRSMSIRILACLEHYGYMEISRVPNSIGKLLEFKVLKR